MAFPHVEWIDLKKNGLLVEVAVVKRDDAGNTFYIRLDTLDNIDKQRMVKILTNRNANAYELYDLMSNISLNNGMNALEYFHQLVMMATASGDVMRPKLGVRGKIQPPTQRKVVESTPKVEAKPKRAYRRKVKK